jgi:two-component system KDP operon response regulator KdpE
MTGQYAVQPLILVVEDERERGSSLVSTLASHGFRTLQASSRAGALTRAVGHEPDVVLLDLSPAGLDAIGLTTRLRDWTSAPIVAIVARSRHDQRAALLEAGASDYILQPFGPGDLLARLRVWLRQKTRQPSLRGGFADTTPERLRIDRDRRTLFVEGHEVHVTPIECKLLLTLAHGRSLTEEQLLKAVWGPESSTRAKYLRAHVRQLRQKIEKDPARPRYLVTEAGGAYRLRLG